MRWNGFHSNLFHIVFSHMDLTPNSCYKDGMDIIETYSTLCSHIRIRRRKSCDKNFKKFPTVYVQICCGCNEQVIR